MTQQENTSYIIKTTRGMLEGIKAGKGVILAADYRYQRFHEKFTDIKVGAKLDGGIVLSIEKREEVPLL